MELQSTDTSLGGQYEIRLTIVMEDYVNVQTTIDFTVYLVELGSGPSYVASRTLKNAEGPYEVANACYTAPDLGLTLTKTFSASSEASLPSYSSYDAANAIVTFDP